MQGSRGIAVELRRPARVFWTLALTTLALDQLTKAVVRSAVTVGEVRPLVPGVLDLTHVRNMGAAFGLFPGRQPIFVATSLVVLLVIAAYWRRDRPTAWPVVTGIALVAGGAVGNLIDRVVLTKVTDFFSFAFMDFPVFNIADMGIVCGVGLLVVWLLFGPEPAQRATGAPTGMSEATDSELGPEDAPIPSGTDVGPPR